MKFSLIILALLLTHPLYSMNNKPGIQIALKTKKKLTKRKRRRKRSKISSSSSKAIRSRTKFGIQAGAGLSNYRLMPFGKVGYALSRDNIFELGYSQIDLIPPGIGQQMQTIGLSWLRFWGNSFYTNLSLSYVDYYAVDNLGFTFEETPITVKEYYKAQAISASLSIGNRWYFSNFFLGCEWVGAGGSLFNFNEEFSYKENEAVSLNDDSEAGDDQQDSSGGKLEIHRKMTTINFLSLAVGVIF